MAYLMGPTSAASAPSLLPDDRAQDGFLAIGAGQTAPAPDVPEHYSNAPGAAADAVIADLVDATANTNPPSSGNTADALLTVLQAHDPSAMQIGDT